MQIQGQGQKSIPISCQAILKTWRRKQSRRHGLLSHVTADSRGPQRLRIAAIELIPDHVSGASVSTRVHSTVLYCIQYRYMASTISKREIPSELDDEVDDAELSSGHIWAYPCKLVQCPDYGKSWQLRSNFLAHLQEREAHAATASTPTERRAIETKWRYTTDPHLPPRAAPAFRPREDPEEQVWTYGFKDNTGKVINGMGTLKQMAMADDELPPPRGVRWELSEKQSGCP